MPALSRKAAQPLINVALREDAARRDITSLSVLPSDVRVRARVIAKAPGVLAGVQVAAWTFQTLDPAIHCVLKRHDGSRVTRGQTVVMVEGHARSIFAAERTALNFLSHLSGIATLTQQFVRQVRGTHAKIMDTRKTLPSLRLLEKYAVRVGGGRSHRQDLSEAILIKTNHLKVLKRQQQSIARAVYEAIRRVRQKSPSEQLIEIEVNDLKELRAALQAQADIVLLDNWSVSNVRKAMALAREERTKSYNELREAITKQKPGHSRSNMDEWNEWITRTLSRELILVEVSGGVTLNNVRAIARTGVDRISIGRLTHSAPAMDVALVVA